MRITLVTVVLLILCGVGFCAESQPPSEKTKRSEHNTDQIQRGTEQSPFVVRTIQTPKSKEETDKDSEERDDRKTLNRFTLCLAVIGFFQLIAFGLQAHRLRQTIGVTEKAANAAQRSAVVAEKSLTMVERPYVFVSDISGFQYDTGREEYFVTYDVSNHGRTPADIERICAVISNDLEAVPGFVDSDNSLYLSPILEAGRKIAGQKQRVPCNIITFTHQGDTITPKLTSTDMIYFKVIVIYRSFLELDWVYENSFFWVFDRNAMAFAPRRDKEYYRNEKYQI